MGDIQFLFCDLFLVTVLVFLIGRGGPSEQLHPCRPPGRLRSLPVFGSLFLHTCIIILGQLAAFFITTKENWLAKRMNGFILQSTLSCLLVQNVYLNTGDLPDASFSTFLCCFRYIPLNSTVFGKDNLPNMENSCVFELSSYQYIFIAAVVTKGYPHNKPFYHNSE